VVPEGVLTDREKLVLVLSFDRDLDGPDIARVLSISDNTVRVLKARALKKLRAAGIQPDGSFDEAA
jgi:DNA-directed RNA polymerase specialized sigma subunit